MCHGEEDGDGVGEDKVGGQLRQEEGEGKDEDGGDEIEEVKEGQTNHQTKDKRKTKIYKKFENTFERCCVCALTSKILQ